jgi:hypothetical protein
MIDLFATVMHVPQIVCVCYSIVNIGKCKQQVTERLLHTITIKFYMTFLFPGCIIIHYNHNHMIKLVKFSWWWWWGGGAALGGWGAVAPRHSQIVLPNFEKVAQNMSKSCSKISKSCLKSCSK